MDSKFSQIDDLRVAILRKDEKTTIYMNNEEASFDTTAHRIREIHEPGFDLAEQLILRQGIFVEIGGPTKSGYRMVDFQALPKKVFIANVNPGVPIYDDMTGKHMGYDGKINIQLDAQKLPFEDGTIGAFFARALPREIIPATFLEVARCLEPGGIFVLESFSPDLIASATGCDLDLKSYVLQRNDDKTLDTSAVLQKY